MAKEIVWKRKLLKRLQEENTEFSKKTEAFLAYISIQDFSTQALKFLQEGIAKINTLPKAHPVSLRIKKQQAALFKHKNENEAVGRFPNSFNSNAIQMALSRNPYYLNLFSSAKAILIDSSEFLGNLIHLCEEAKRLKQDQEILNEAINALLREDGNNEKEFCRIIEQCRENEKFFNNFKRYSEIVKETYTLVKECTLQSNELANKIEQVLKILVSNKQWDNKAVKFFAKNVPDGIEKMRAVLSNSVLSHENKIIDIVNIVKQKVEQPRYFRNKCVYQFYQQLNNVLKQHYPNLYILENKKQVPSYFFYDERSGDEKVHNINTILLGLHQLPHNVAL